MRTARPVRLARPPIDRIMERVEKSPSGCWIFTGHLNEFGYGRMATGSRTDRSARSTLTHRIAYEDKNGAIPDGLVIDHLCRNRACCNPDHLEAVTQVENVMRGEGPASINARKTHCPSGHEYDQWNTRLYTRPLRGPASSGIPGRICRACDNNRSATRKKAA